MTGELPPIAQVVARRYASRLADTAPAPLFADHNLLLRPAAPPRSPSTPTRADEDGASTVLRPATHGMGRGRADRDLASPTHPASARTGGPRAATAHRVVDWQLVYRIRDRLADRLSTELGPEAGEAERVARGRALLPEVIREYSDEAILTGRVADQVARAEVAAYVRAVDSAIFGYGRWQPLLDDPDVENIEFCAN